MIGVTGLGSADACGGAAGNGADKAPGGHARRLGRDLAAEIAAVAYAGAVVTLIWFLNRETDATRLGAALGVFALLSPLAAGALGFRIGSRRATRGRRAPAGARGSGITPLGRAALGTALEKVRARIAIARGFR